MLRLCTLLLAAAALASASFAHATPVTYNITNGILYGSGGGTYSGTATIDSVTGAFSGGKFSATLLGQTFNNLNFVQDKPFAADISGPQVFGGLFKSGNSWFFFDVLPSADGGYEGGGVCTGQTCLGHDTEFTINVNIGCNAGCATGNGGYSIDPNAATDFPPASLPSAATPEPSSLVLLGTGIVGAAGTARRRFLTR